MRVVDLFAGCGGMSRGFQDAGFEIVGAFELWDTAAACYRGNFNHPVFQTNLSDIDAAVSQVRALHPDIIIGGPPCQDFSHAGKRVEAGRASLTGSYADIIKEICPAMFVMENVDRAAQSNAYVYARSIFKAAGYGLTEIVLNASLCGVPQKRKRFFCIGMLGANDGFATEYIISHMGSKETTLYDYFGDTLGFEYYYRHPRNYSRRAIFSIQDPAPTMRGVNRPLPKGYPGHPKDACPLNDELRSLTTLERALIQTFPPDFRWSGSKTEMEQMIGNAVPVKLAKFVGTAVMHFAINAPAIKIDKAGFLKWLSENCTYVERTQRDFVSHVKRANSMLSLDLTSIAHYIFSLEQTAKYQELTKTVRSHLKKAVLLYAQYEASFQTIGA